MIFRIEDEVLLALKSEASQGVGVEVCGLLWADRERIVRHYSSYPGPLFPHRFEIDPAWMLEKFTEWRQRGGQFGGYYHSHPKEMPLLPSSIDLLGHPPHSYLLILSEIGDECRAFRTRSQVGECEEKSIVVMKKAGDFEHGCHCTNRISPKISRRSSGLSPFAGETQGFST